MTAYEQLEHQLRVSVVRHAGGATSRTQRLRWPWSRPLSALAIAASCALVAAITVLAIGTIRHGAPSRPLPSLLRSGQKPPGKAPPAPGPIPSNVDDAAVASSYNAAARTDRTCSPAPALSRNGTISQGSPGPALLSLLPALARPATPSDRLPSILDSRGGGLMFARGATVYGRYIRRARVVYGRTIYLVPAGNLGRAPVSPAVAEHCYRLLVAALRARLSTVPSPERAATLRYGLEGFARDRWNLETSTVYSSVFLVMSGGGGEEASGGQPLSVIRQTGLIGEDGGGSSNPEIVMDGVVPPGVATVTFTFPATRYHNRHLPPLSVTSNVVNSVFAFVIPTLFERGGWPSEAIWRSSSGQVIKTINENPFHP